MLENSGVFAILVNALEAIVKPLANSTNTIIRQLASFLPVIIGLFGQFAAIVSTVLAAGLRALLDIANGMARRFPVRAHPPPPSGHVEQLSSGSWRAGITRWPSPSLGY